MSWLPASTFHPHLPKHCLPENEFLTGFSQIFHVCIPTPLAFLSNLLGTLSIIAWLFAQLPQIYKNWSIQSTSGLSIFFLVEWCLGDLGNLLGALFTHQASWQVAIGAYYVFVDLCLVGQWIWYERLKHGRPVFFIRSRSSGRRDDAGSSGSMDPVVIEGMPIDDERSDAGPSQQQDNNSDSDKGQGGQQTKPRSRPQIIFQVPSYQRYDKTREKSSPNFSSTPGGTTIHRLGTSTSSFPAPSPRTVLLVACLVALVQASPVTPTQRTSHLVFVQDTAPTPLEQAGTILSWTSTILYLGSRLPQLLKNWQRKSTAGLSPHLFIAAFCGNLFYSSALLTNPSGWYDFGPYGGRGWAGPEGSKREAWVLAALPFFLGAAGVLVLDASVGVQFLVYGEGAEKLVVVGDQGVDGRRWRWRRVSGWMRGWIPSTERDVSKASEREALIRRDTGGQHGQRYGAL